MPKVFVLTQRLLITASSAHISMPVQNDAVIQKRACGCLGQLASDPENRAIIGQEQGIELVLAAMREHKNVMEVQSRCCVALANIAYLNLDNAVEIGRAGGIQMILTAMSAFGRRKEVEQWARMALLTLAVETENARIMGKEGCVHAAIGAITQDVASCMWGCTLLTRLARIPENKKILGDDANLNTLLRILKEQNREKLVFTAACEVLRQVSYTAENKVKIGKKNCGSLVLTGMALNQKDAKVQEVGLSLLSSLVMNADNRLTMLEQGCAQSILNTMDRHTHEPQVQTMGCNILRQLASHAVRNDCQVQGTKSKRPPLGNLMNIRILLAAMSAHKTHRPVLASLCSILYVIAENNSHASNVVREGGVMHVIRAMTDNLRARDVAIHAIKLLARLAKNVALVDRIRFDGGREAIERVMAAHEGDAAVTEVAGLALKALEK
jgi:hypothetical protein